MAAISWHDMFSLGLPVAEKILRPLVIYFFLIIALRLAGKRELAQLNPFDLVVLLTLSNAVQNAIIGEDNSVTGGIIGASTLLIVNYVVVRFLYNHQPIEQLIEGEADVLMQGGQLNMDRLRKEMITLPELEAAAHRQGFASLEDVDRIVLESGGTLSFIAKKPPPEETRQQDLLRRLNELTREVAALRHKLEKQ